MANSASDIPYLPLRLLSRCGRYGPAVSLILSYRLQVDKRIRGKLGADPVVAVRRLGLDWELNLESNHNRALFAMGVYDAPLLRFLKEAMRPGDVFLDVGANAGLFTLPLANRLREYGEGRVVAVEPARDVLVDLQRNIEINDLTGWVDVVPKAVGSNPGMASLRAGDDSGDAGLRTLAGDGAEVELVEMTTVDSALEEVGREPTIIKVDVEGWEMEVLKGAERCLDDAALRVVVVEAVESHLERAGSSTRALHGFLSDRGFTAHWIRHRGPSPVIDLSENHSANLAYTR